jgi:hypothetical protein
MGRPRALPTVLDQAEEHELVEGAEQGALPLAWGQA